MFSKYIVKIYVNQFDGNKKNILTQIIQLKIKIKIFKLRNIKKIIFVQKRKNRMNMKMIFLANYIFLFFQKEKRRQNLKIQLNILFFNFKNSYKNQIKKINRTLYFNFINSYKNSKISHKKEKFTQNILALKLFV